MAHDSEALVIQVSARVNANAKRTRGTECEREIVRREKAGWRKRLGSREGERERSSGRS